MSVNEPHPIADRLVAEGLSVSLLQFKKKRGGSSCPDGSLDIRLSVLRRMNHVGTRLGDIKDTAQLRKPLKVRFLDQTRYRRGHLPIGSGVADAACRTACT